MQLFSARGERRAFGGERKRYRTSPPISRRSASERVFSTSLHIMTPAAEKAPLLPHCTAFIPLESRGGASISAANPLNLQREPPLPWATSFSKMVPGEPLSSSWLAKHHRTSHFANVRSQPNAAGKREGETDRMRKPCASRQLEACFVRLSDRIGSAALCAPVAQRIERRFPKPCVGGSSPLRGATFLPAVFGFLLPNAYLSHQYFSNSPKALARGGAMCLQWLHNFKASPLMTRSGSFRETGRRRGLWRIPGKLGAEGARRNTWSQAFR